MKKLLVLSTVHRWDDNRILFKEIESLKKLDLEIYYCVQHENNEIFNFNGIKIIPLPIPNNKFERIFKLQKLVSKLIEEKKYDIIHFHDPELIYLMSKVKRKRHSKIIFDIHENISSAIQDKTWIPKIFRKLISKSYRLLETKLIKNFDKLIIAETSYRKVYGQKPIEILNFPKLEPEVKEKDFSTINFVYAGDITEIRGIWQMLKIVNKIYEKRKNIHFDLIGRFAPESLQESVEEFLIENNIENVVKIHGRIKIAEVNQILKKSHIGFSLLKPIGNYLESLPTKIFDYMNNKVVPVASDFPLYLKYLDKPNTGITVNYNNIENSVEKILAILDNNVLSEKNNNGFSLIKSNWNWEKEEEKLLKIYREII